MIDNARSESARDVSVIFTGLRPGDKMSEEFLYQNEFAESTGDPRLFQLKTQSVPANGFARHMSSLAKYVEERNLSSMIETVCQIVPDYRPTALLDPSKKSAFA
jgi:FlaA1/EpsC-like NDP-sugar epimerase